MDSTVSSLLTLFGFMGLIQGLGMKYNKAIRKKLMLDAEGIDKKYINFKINFLMFTGTWILVIQVISHFTPVLGEKLNILLSAFLLLAITSDLVYKKMKIRKKAKKS